MAHPDGTVVSVHYRGTLEDGSVFDASHERGPLEFTLGSGQVIPLFEQAVATLDVGASTTVTIAPDDAYGVHDPNAIQEAPLEIFGDEAPELGSMVQLQAPDGTRLVATIVELVDEGTVKLDFNHPLAGETLTFEIELVGVSGAE